MKFQFLQRIKPFCIILFFSFYTSFAQTPQVDSLKRELVNADSALHSDILYQIAYEFIDLDNTSALRYAKMGMNEARRLNDSTKIVRLGRILALAYRRISRLDSSLIISLEVLPIARRNRLEREQTYLLNGLGSIYTQQGSYHKALEFHLESLRLREANKDTFEIAVALNNIGLLFYKLKDYRRALDYFDRSISLRERIGNRYDFEIPLLNAASTYVYLGDFKRASSFIDRALNYCGSGCSENVLMQKDFVLGVLSFLTDDLRNSENYFKASLNRAVIIGDERLEFDNVLYLIRICLNTNRLDLAESYLKNRIQEIERLNSSYNHEIVELYKQFYLFYEKRNDHQKVAEYQRYYIELKDSIFGEELATNLMSVQADYLHKEHLTKMESKNEVLALKEKIIVQQRYVTIFIATVAILLSCLVVTLIKINNRKQRLNRLLDNLVKKRTFELTNKRNDLQRAFDEKEIVLNKLITKVKSSVATIKGLCILAMRDKSETSSYLDSMRGACDKMIHMLNELFDGENNLESYQ